jgi:hypothetical protein
VDLRDFFAALHPAFSFPQIVNILNMRGEPTRRGKPWTDVAVQSPCRRLGIGMPCETVSSSSRSPDGRYSSVVSGAELGRQGRIGTNYDGAIRITEEPS